VPALSRIAAPLAAVLLLAACKPSTFAGPSPAPSEISTGKAGLVHVHDPGKVTYSISPHSCHARGSGTRLLPDRHCTPGAVDPAVTSATLDRTICRTGYTKTVRPPVDQTEPAKHRMYKAYGIPESTTSELDHLVPLELGGSNDITNLWIETGEQPNPKDRVENDLRRAVCDHRVSLTDAQAAIAIDWTTAENRLNVG